jgi:segregation and condensation protein A
MGSGRPRFRSRALRWCPCWSSICRNARRLALDETAEYLHLAAALCDWKARLLLPRDPALGEPDPREQLAAALESELRRARSAGVAPSVESEAVEAAPAGLSLLDLMLLLHEVEQRATLAAAEPAEPEITVADQIRWLLAQLPAFAASPTGAATLFAAQPARRAVNCLLLALLELGKQGILLLDQPEPFGEIWVKAAAYK